MRCFEEFNKYLLEIGRSPHTAKSYREAVEGFARFLEETTGEPFDPRKILLVDVKAYKGYLLSVLKRSPKTVNQRLAALRAFFEFLVGKGVLKKNPAEGVPDVKIQKTTAPRSLTKNELYRLRRKVHAGGNKRDIAIFELLANTGVRVGELCALELDDVEISERKGSITVRQGKGGKFRTVPLNKDARSALRDYLEARPASASRKVFLGERGPLTPSGVFRILKKYALQAGLPDVSPHTLRHTFAKRLLDAGEDLVEVARLLGHANINTTAVYTQPTEEDMQRAVEKLSL